MSLLRIPRRNYVSLCFLHVGSTVVMYLYAFCTWAYLRDEQTDTISEIIFMTRGPTEPSRCSRGRANVKKQTSNDDKTYTFYRRKKYYLERKLRKINELQQLNSLQHSPNTLYADHDELLIIPYCLLFTTSKNINQNASY